MAKKRHIAVPGDQPEKALCGRPCGEGYIPSSGELPMDVFAILKQVLWREDRFFRADSDPARNKEVADALNLCSRCWMEFRNGYNPGAKESRKEWDRLALDTQRLEAGLDSPDALRDAVVGGLFSEDVWGDEPLEIFGESLSKLPANTCIRFQIRARRGVPSSVFIQQSSNEAPGFRIEITAQGGYSGLMAIKAAPKGATPEDVRQALRESKHSGTDYGKTATVQWRMLRLVSEDP